MNQLDKVKAKVYISILEELPLTVEVAKCFSADQPDNLPRLNICTRQAAYSALISVFGVPKQTINAFDSWSQDIL
ncbi:hypothetical protein ACN38_g10058 [Penicillium nordicum]|uniref:Uncharacterized protein n=1 Tax=Penicillium nordicum TaxID=229535 RepID=A0A0N0RXY8_9EURO|nr:hypothetical protein ACN38_g10058 [Penicillium nordicum]